MVEKRNWIQMDKCFCSASWGKCKNTNCYRYFGEPEKKYCEENPFELYSVSDFQNICEDYAKQVIKDGIFTDEHKEPYLWQKGDVSEFVYVAFSYNTETKDKSPMIGLHKHHKDDMDKTVEKVIVPYTEFCKDYHLFKKEGN